MNRRFYLLLVLALGLGAAGLRAGVIYNLRDSRYFPDTGSAITITTNGTFTSTTSVSLPDSFSSSPGDPAANIFDATASVFTGTFTLGTHNSVTIGTDTTDYQNLGLLSIVESGIQDTSVTITGGTGTGYLLPTFHVFGTLSDTNPNAYVDDLICSGNAFCALSDTFGPITSGFHNVDGTYTPAIGSSTSFQFGTPFVFFFFFGSGIQGNGLAGGTAVADLTLQLSSFEVVDANAVPIPGAQVHSQFFDMVAAPEPGTLPMGLAAAGLMGLRSIWSQLRKSRYRNA